MMFHRSFAWIVLALYELCLGSFADASLADTRHYVPPPVKHVAIQFPVYKSSELMVSPCRPEIDGYFGGTSGQPIILEYAFSMDSYENANIDDALEQVREYVMDLVVGAVFPKTCKTRDLQVRELQLVGKVTGFRFDDKMKRDNLRKYGHGTKEMSNMKSPAHLHFCALKIRASHRIQMVQHVQYIEVALLCSGNSKVWTPQEF